MNLLPGRFRILLVLALGLALAGSVFAFSGSEAIAANPTPPQPSDICKTVTFRVMHFTELGQLSGCRSFRSKDSPKQVEMGGSGTWSFTFGVCCGFPSSGGITWNPPFEGSTSANPVGISLGSSQSSQSIMGNKDRCPKGTTEKQFGSNVTSGDDAGGLFTFEMCENNANLSVFTQERATKAVITEP